MYINETHISTEVDDPYSHLKTMLLDCVRVMTRVHETHNKQIDYYEALETVRCINDFCSLYSIPTVQLSTGIPSDGYGILVLLRNYYSAYVLTSPSAPNYIERFQNNMYELTLDEFTKIQTAIDGLRNLIQMSSINDAHKERLLKKLEDMQKSLHQKMSSFDKFLGGMVSFGTAIGKTFNEAKPVLEFVHEIVKTITNAQHRKDEGSEGTLQIGVEEILQIELHVDNI